MSGIETVLASIDPGVFAALDPEILLQGPDPEAIAEGLEGDVDADSGYGAIILQLILAVPYFIVTAVYEILFG